MLNTILKYTGLFILLLAIQVLLLNNIQFSGYVNPYVYILFILLLPIETPSWLLLILAFMTGLTVDLTSGTLGLHTSATVFAGFIRPYVLNVLSPHEGYEPGDMPGIGTFGLRWFITYVLVIVLLHHIFLFYIEVFRFEYFFRTLLRALLSTGFSVLFIIIVQSIIIRR
ncbi:MAG: rod shape-determining protein MreD [Bacteroidales bacterium]|jgi:rod shape-determining protein MreD|nr:rod shape-determining protein MreD [Bacteroidales bacterium]